jgi:hypothetical protein
MKTKRKLWFAVLAGLSMVVAGYFGFLAFMPGKTSVPLVGLLWTSSVLVLASGAVVLVGALGFADMKVVAANRHELLVSMVVVITAALFQAVPIGFVGALVLGAAMVFGLLCAVNAALDMDEMGVIETYVAGLWLIAMLILTPWTLYWIASIREFAKC